LTKGEVVKKIVEQKVFAEGEKNLITYEKDCKIFCEVLDEVWALRATQRQVPVFALWTKFLDEKNYKVFVFLWTHALPRRGKKFFREIFSKFFFGTLDRALRATCCPPKAVQVLKKK
jgi:hypothetical protein